MTVITRSHTYFKQNGTVLISSTLPPFQVSDISQWVNNALRENKRGKDKETMCKDSYDIDQAGQQIIRQQATWNSEQQIVGNLRPLLIPLVDGKNIILVTTN